MFCYYHKEFVNKEVELPDNHEPMGFCNEKEHEQWADKNYGKKGEEKMTHTVKRIQQELLRMGKEEKQKKII